MTSGAKLLLGLLLVAIGGLAVERIQVAHYNHQLATVRDSANAAQGQLHASIVAAAVLRGQSSDAARQRDSLLERERVLARQLLRATITIPNVPSVTPDTCLPWQRRADSLAVALALSQRVTATADSAGTAGIVAAHDAQAAADTAIHAGQHADTSLGRIAAKVPSAPFRSPLISVAVDGRWTPDPVGRHVAASVIVKGFYAGLEGRVQGTQLTGQLMVGYRRELRLW